MEENIDLSLSEKNESNSNVLESESNHPYSPDIKSYKKRGRHSYVESELRLSETLGFSCTLKFKEEFHRRVPSDKRSEKLRKIVEEWMAIQK